MQSLVEAFDAGSVQEHFTHMVVEYASTIQKTNGIWFQVNMDWYDRSLGHYFWSNRILIPFIIMFFIGLTYALMLTFFFSYNAYWCMNWDANLGNSKYSFCRQPQPNTLKT